MSAPVIAEMDTGGPLTVEQITERLDEFGVPAVSHPAPVDGTNSNGSRFSRRCLVNRVAKARPRTRDRTLFGAVKDAARQGDLDNELVAALTAAAQSTSVPGDEFTDVEIARAIRSGMRSAGVTQYDAIAESDAEVKPAAVLRTNAERAAALAEAHRVFRKWLGDDYDLDALDVVLAALAVERLVGDLLWLLLVSGSGNAKTETVQSVHDVVHTHLVSTIASPGALLSATSKRDRAADASGGLLRVIGEHGVLVIKDVTSILSMSRELRAEVLAALREMYDGRWTRTVGTDGGRTLDWSGRIAVIGAVTTAWDTAHAVIASMGDRFVLLRLDSTTGRLKAGRRAIDNTGSETDMRAELAAAVADVMAGMDTTAINLTDTETEKLLAAADLVTRARTGVEYDYQGNVSDSHAPEMPTRFAKQLAQVVRGGVAVGMSRDAAMRLAIRCARDSMPPQRLAILEWLAYHPLQSTAQVRKGINKPRNTVDRQLQALHMLGVLDCDEEDISADKTRWIYSLAEGVDPSTLKVSSRNVSG
jgi:hypothetical protein